MKFHKQILLFLLLTCNLHAAAPSHHLSIMAIFRDTARFFPCWIEYHRMMGVDHFYLMNNLSEDNYEEVLAPYVDEGIVELIEYPTVTNNFSEYQAFQKNAYNFLLDRLKKETEWVAVIDIDEFIVPLGGESIPEFIEEFEDFGGLVINWQVYGTSRVRKLREDEPIFERLVMRAEKNHGFNRCMKTIAKPSRIASFACAHNQNYIEGYYAVNEHKQPVHERIKTPTLSVDRIRINHYTEGDEWYFYRVKVPCRQRWFKTPKGDPWLQPSKEFNKVYDPLMVPFAPEIKMRMQK